MKDTGHHFVPKSTECYRDVNLILCAPQDTIFSFMHGLDLFRRRSARMRWRIRFGTQRIVKNDGCTVDMPQRDVRMAVHAASIKTTHPVKSGGRYHLCEPDVKQDQQQSLGRSTIVESGCPSARFISTSPIPQAGTTRTE